MWFLVYVLPKYVLYKLFMVAQEYLRALPHLCNKTLFQASVLEPDGAPQNVRGQNSSSTSILVMWDEVPTDQQNGIITGYTIIYQSQTENDSGNVQANGSLRQRELTNLKEYVNYNITVFASTAIGDGPSSHPIVVRTDQDSKLFV